MLIPSFGRLNSKCSREPYPLSGVRKAVKQFRHTHPFAPPRKKKYAEPEDTCFCPTSTASQLLTAGARRSSSPPSAVQVAAAWLPSRASPEQLRTTRRDDVRNIRRIEMDIGLLCGRTKGIGTLSPWKIVGLDGIGSGRLGGPRVFRRPDRWWCSLHFHESFKGVS